MTPTARDAMQTDVHTVEPGMSLADLERRFLSARVTGFPVVEKGRLVGLVSRSDVVRQLEVEQTQAEVVSDYYRDMGIVRDEPDPDLRAIADRVGQRLEGLKVADVMVHDLITVSPDAPLREVAATLVEHHIHRVPVVEDGRLLGIVSSLDLARLLAEGRL